MFFVDEGFISQSHVLMFKPFALPNMKDFYLFDNPTCDRTTEKNILFFLQFCIKFLNKCSHDRNLNLSSRLKEDALKCNKKKFFY